MPRLLRSEIFRLRRRWMPWILLLTIAAIGVGFYILVYVSAQAQLEGIRAGRITEQPGTREAMEQALRELRPDRVQNFGVGLVGGLGSVMLIVFAASHVGTEFGWGTLRTLLAHGAGRGTFLTAKLLSLPLFAAVFMLVGVGAATIGSFVASAIAGADLGGIDPGEIAKAAALTYYSFFPYLALAAVIAVWSRSAGAGIAAGLVVYFAESVVADILVALNRDFANIVNYGLSRNVSALQRVRISTSAGGADGGQAATLLEPWQAAIVLGAYTVLFVALAYWRLRTRDVTLS